MILPFVQTPPAFDFKVEPGRGLTVFASGVPLVRGSYFQIVSPDWKKAYFSAAGEQKVERVDPDTVRLSFKGADVEGSHTYHRKGDRLKVHYEFRYDGDGPAIVELAAGFVWLPALAGRPKAAPPPTETIGGRRLGPDSPTFGFTGPMGPLEGTASEPLTVFDARGYPQSWAEGRDVLWVGDLALPLEKGKTTAMDLEWRIPSLGAKESAPLKRRLEPVRIDDAQVPNESRPPLIPKPQLDQLDYAHPIEVTGGWSLPIGEFDHFDAFKAALSRRYIVPPPTSKAKKVAIDGGVSRLGLKPGGYRLTLDRAKGITVVGEEDTGLRNAVERLAQLAFAKDGRLWLPSGYLYDDPKVRWRGVHLFGGPNARAFQKNLWTRVLRPLGFDHVVLQCERTAWDAAPGIATPTSMTKAQLGDLFALYRNLGVDAVPLIQSFGHMEWLFANGKNLDLAMNPSVPYAIDPRKPRAQEVMGKIWDEAIALARPKTVHFGLDEVAMRGWMGGDAFLTDTWKLQLGFLSALAKRNEVTPMLWGDQALFGKEAPDATLAGTQADAQARRDAIPKYAWVTDWHYKADAKPETFLKTLQLWKDAGVRPIAATWYRPENIRGFGLAAGLLDCGLLQTTWAGYESSEEGMLENMDQFGAMVLAADYGWSGRKEMPNDLPYDANEVFRKLYFGRPSPLAPRPGTALDGTTPFTVGDVRFRTLDLRLASILRPDPKAGGSLDLEVNLKGRELDLALATELPAEVGEAVAEIRVERSGAPPLVERLVYGRDVRALTDPLALTKGDRSPGGPSAYRFDLGKPGTTVTRIVVRPLNRYSGLRLMGATTVD